MRKEEEGFFFVFFSCFCRAVVYFGKFWLQFFRDMGFFAEKFSTSPKN